MKELILTLIIFSVFSCNVRKKETGIQKEKSDIEEMILISSGSFEPSKKIIQNGIEFTIVLKNNDTIYQSTNDNKFITPEGYKIGDKLQEISDVYKTKMRKMLGWGYYIKLKSGWQLGFCEGKSCTDSVPNNNSIVKWIFKRKE